MTTCEVADCERPNHHRKPYCHAHLMRIKRRGDPLAGGPLPPLPSCGVDGCSRPTINGGYCSAHYQRLRRTGDPQGFLSPSAEERLWSRIDRRGPDECWPWTGGVNGHGYGRINWNGQRGARAHRVLFELLHGPLAEDQVVRHTCDHPPCCNPAHLVPGGHAENMDDMVRRGRRERRWTDEQLEAVRTDPRPGDVVAAEYGMSKSYVYLVRRQYKRGMNRSFSA